MITSKYCICKTVGTSLPVITVTDRTPWKANSGLSLLLCSNIRHGVGQGDCIQFWKVPGRIFTPFPPVIQLSLDICQGMLYLFFFQLPFRYILEFTFGVSLGMWNLMKWPPFERPYTVSLISPPPRIIRLISDKSG